MKKIVKTYTVTPKTGTPTLNNIEVDLNTEITKCNLTIHQISSVANLLTIRRYAQQIKGDFAKSRTLSFIDDLIKESGKIRYFAEKVENTLDIGECQQVPEYFIDRL